MKSWDLMADGKALSGTLGKGSIWKKGLGTHGSCESEDRLDMIIETWAALFQWRHLLAPFYCPEGTKTPASMAASEYTQVGSLAAAVSSSRQQAFLWLLGFSSDRESRSRATARALAQQPG